MVRDPGHVPAQRTDERGAARRRYRYRRGAGGRPDGLQADGRASTRRAAVASAGRPARTRKRNSGDCRRAGNCRAIQSGEARPPDVTWSFAASAGRHSRRTAVAGIPGNEHLRHAHPDAGMLTMANPSGTGGARLPSHTVGAADAPNSSRTSTSPMRNLHGMEHPLMLPWPLSAIAVGHFYRCVGNYIADSVLGSAMESKGLYTHRTTRSGALPTGSYGWYAAAASTHASAARREYTRRALSS